MTTVGALQNQELMAQGKDFSLQSCPSSEAGGHREKQRGKKGKHGSGRVPTAASQIQPLQWERTFW
jgi:hypothetical protein